MTLDGRNVNMETGIATKFEYVNFIYLIEGSTQ
jgi:hypothetical protein